MFYRIVAFALIALGLLFVLTHLSWPIDITPDSLEFSAIGLTTMFIGLLNLAFVYETPEAKYPQIILLAANLIYIGFAILLITSHIADAFGYVTIGLSLINCIMVLNHKV